MRRSFLSGCTLTAFCVAVPILASSCFVPGRVDGGPDGDDAGSDTMVDTPAPDMSVKTTTTGTDGGGTTTTGGVDPGNNDNCGVQNFKLAQPVTPDLLLIQDRSGSMKDGVNDNKNPPAGQSKWELMRAAIEQVVTSTVTVDWGLLLFASDDSCGVNATPDVAPGPNTGAAIKALLTTTAASSSTPTTAAVNSAVAYYKKLNDGRPHFLVLATDGEPTCGGGGGGFGGGGADDAAAEQAVADAAAAGIHTFVVGIGGNTGADATLATMAMNGKEPNTTAGQRPYYSVSSTQDLVNVLQKVTGQIISCTYALAGAPSDPTLVTIQGSNGPVKHDTAHGNGWDFGANDLTVVFYGATCTDLQTGALTGIQAIYGCPPIN